MLDASPVDAFGFDSYQQSASTMAIYAGRFEWLGISYAVAGLASEAGEVASVFKKQWRDRNGEIDREFKDKMAAELGDCLWYISDLATQLNLSLEEIAFHSLNKLQSRKNRGKLQGSGDER